VLLGSLNPIERRGDLSDKIVRRETGVESVRDCTSQAISRLDAPDCLIDVSSPLRGGGNSPLVLPARYRHVVYG